MGRYSRCTRCVIIGYCLERGEEWTRMDVGYCQQCGGFVLGGTLTALNADGGEQRIYWDLVFGFHRIRAVPPCLVEVELREINPIPKSVCPNCRDRPDSGPRSTVLFCQKHRL